jgi:hypothetical protein
MGVVHHDTERVLFVQLSYSQISPNRRRLEAIEHRVDLAQLDAALSRSLWIATF